MVNEMCLRSDICFWCHSCFRLSGVSPDSTNSTKAMKMRLNVSQTGNQCIYGTVLIITLMSSVKCVNTWNCLTADLYWSFHRVRKLHLLLQRSQTVDSIDKWRGHESTLHHRNSTSVATWICLPCRTCIANLNFLWSWVTGQNVCNQLWLKSHFYNKKLHWCQFDNDELLTHKK